MDMWHVSKVQEAAKGKDLLLRRKMPQRQSKEHKAQALQAYSTWLIPEIWVGKKFSIWLAEEADWVEENIFCL